MWKTDRTGPAKRSRNETGLDTHWLYASACGQYFPSFGETISNSDLNASH